MRPSAFVFSPIMRDRDAKNLCKKLQPTSGKHANGQLEEWKRKALQNVHAIQREECEGERTRDREKKLKQEIEWKKHYNNPNKIKRKPEFKHKQEWNLEDNWDPSAIK